MEIAVSNQAVCLSQAANTILRTGGHHSSNEETEFRKLAFQYTLHAVSDLDNLKNPVEWMLGELKANTPLHRNQNIAADIILGMAQAFPGKKLRLLEAVLQRDDYLDYNIEGVTTGLIEACNVGEWSLDMEVKLFKTLSVGGVTSRLCDAKSTKPMQGRISSALREFIIPAWKNDSRLSYRLELISVLIEKLYRMMWELSDFPYFLPENGYNIPGPTKPMTCLEYLCDEMTKRFLIESGLSFRMKMIGEQTPQIMELRGKILL